MAVALFALGLLSVVGADGYVSYAQRQQTTTWRTYRNEKYGFEIQYPNKQGWRAEERSGFGSPLSVLLFSDTSTQPLPMHVRIEVEPGRDTPWQIAWDARHWDSVESIEPFWIGGTAGVRVMTIDNLAFSTAESPTNATYDWTLPKTILYYFQNAWKSPTFRLSISPVKPNREKEILRIVERVIWTLKFPRK